MRAAGVRPCPPRCRGCRPRCPLCEPPLGCKLLASAVASAQTPPHRLSAFQAWPRGAGPRSAQRTSHAPRYFFRALQQWAGGGLAGRRDGACTPGAGGSVARPAHDADSKADPPGASALLTLTEPALVSCIPFGQPHLHQGPLSASWDHPYVRCPCLSRRLQAASAPNLGNTATAAAAGAMATAAPDGSGLSSERTKIGVLGGGAWGTALALHAARMGHGVLLWALEERVARQINEEHENKTFLPVCGGVACGRGGACVWTGGHVTACNGLPPAPPSSHTPTTPLPCYLSPLCRASRCPSRCAPPTTSSRWRRMARSCSSSFPHPLWSARWVGGGGGGEPTAAVIVHPLSRIAVPRPEGRDFRITLCKACVLPAMLSGRTVALLRAAAGQPGCGCCAGGCHPGQLHQGHPQRHPGDAQPHPEARAAPAPAQQVGQAASVGGPPDLARYSIWYSIWYLKQRWQEPSAARLEPCRLPALWLWKQSCLRWLPPQAGLPERPFVCGGSGQGEPHRRHHCQRG